MNILITGPATSGKTAVMMALVAKYKQTGQSVTVCEAGDSPPLEVQSPSLESERQRADYIKRMYARKGEHDKHFVLTIQSAEYLDIAPYQPRKFFDYYIQTKRPSK